MFRTSTAGPLLFKKGHIVTLQTQIGTNLLTVLGILHRSHLERSEKEKNTVQVDVTGLKDWHETTSTPLEDIQTALKMVDP